MHLTLPSPRPPPAPPPGDILSPEELSSLSSDPACLSSLLSPGLRADLLMAGSGIDSEPDTEGGGGPDVTDMDEDEVVSCQTPRGAGGLM